MSQRIRGQEVTFRVAVDGSIQTGLFKVTDLSITPRTDLVEESYLGELEDDLDIQHHGFDMSFSVHNEDANALEFLDDIISREQSADSHPSVTVTVIYVFRKPGVRNKVEVYYDCFLKVAEMGFGGRKEYVTTQFELKAKSRKLLSA